MEIPFGITPHHFHVLMSGRGDDTFMQALRDYYHDNHEALEFIEKTYGGGEYMQTHQDLLLRRSEHGRSGLKKALIGKLNDLT